MTNKYSEGLPGARYYGGNEYIDKMERLCQVSSIGLSLAAPVKSASLAQNSSCCAQNFDHGHSCSPLHTVVLDILALGFDQCAGFAQQASCFPRLE